VYGWIWRHLPGGWWGRLGGSFVLLLAALALLFYVLFPWIEPRLPFNHVTITPGGVPTAPPSTPSPTATPVQEPSPLPGG
jgi:hypothetical protein